MKVNGLSTRFQLREKAPVEAEQLLEEVKRVGGKEKGRNDPFTLVAYLIL